MRARNVSLLVTLAIVVYLVLLAQRGVALLRTGEPVPVVLGAGVLLLPVVGVWVVVATWRSGTRIQRLARKLDAEGGLPDLAGLPRLPSGRIERGAADEWFEQCRAEVDAEPRNWRRWYWLAYAYDVAGDRRRARSSMRTAVDLEASERD